MQTGTTTTTTTKMEFVTTPAPAEYCILSLYRLVPLVLLVADDDAVDDCGGDDCGGDEMSKSTSTTTAPPPSPPEWTHQKTRMRHQADGIPEFISSVR